MFRWVNISISNKRILDTLTKLPNILLKFLFQIVAGIFHAQG